jgi:hypothetical protein
MLLGSMSRLQKAGVALLLVAALLAGVIVASTALGVGTPELGGFRGARLGMTATAVRARFEEPALGKWESAPSGTAEDTALLWRAAGGPWEARFEFHSGMLVAVRAVAPSDDPVATRAPLEISKGIVRTRAAGDGETVKVTILARDCPTHHAEAERLATGK